MLVLRGRLRLLMLMWLKFFKKKWLRRVHFIDVLVTRTRRLLEYNQPLGRVRKHEILTTYIIYNQWFKSII